MTDTNNEPVDTGSQQLDIAARIEADAKAAEPAKEAVEVASANGDETQNTDTEESANSDGNDAPAQQPRKKPGVHQRIDELTKQKHDLARERDALRAELDAKSKPQQATPAQAATSDGKPTLEDFDFDTASYLEALADWKLGERDREVQKTQAREQEKAREASFEVQAAAFAAEHPDFYDRLQDPTLRVTEAMKAVVLETDNPPAVAYHLATHPDEAAAIAQMTPTGAARAIGRIEASLSAPKSVNPPPQPVSVTKAPAPVATLKSAGTVSKDLDQLSMAEYVAERNKQAQRGR